MRSAEEALPAPRRRAWISWLLQRASVSLITLLVLAALLELSFRHLGINYHNHDPGLRSMFKTGCFRPSLTRGYEPVPGTCRQGEHGMLKVGDAASTGLAPFRLLVIGDSVAHQHYWVEVMQRTLQALARDRGVEAYNAGVPGYDTCSEARLLAEVGLKVKPQVADRQSQPPGWASEIACTAS